MSQLIPEAAATEPQDKVKIRTEGLKKSFGDLVVLDGIDVTIKHGEVVCVIGPSGSGKSTFLRCLNKLEDITGGTVIVDDFDVSDPKVNLDEVRQHIGMVFQHFNLFPHMTVIENVTLAPLLTKKMDKAAAEKNSRTAGSGGSGGEGARQAGDAVGRPETARRHRPSARDEPVDHAVRRGHQRAGSRDGRGRPQVLRELASGGMTMVVVTHEMGFAREVASRVLFMADGKIVEDDSPAEVFDNPKHPRLQEFLSKVL